MQCDIRNGDKSILDPQKRFNAERTQTHRLTNTQYTIECAVVVLRCDGEESRKKPTTTTKI